MERPIQAPPVGAILGGSHKLIRFLGAGAIGAVYEATTESDERVAIKVLHEVSDSEVGRETMKRFTREGQIAASLKSDHIVTAIEAELDPHYKIPYLVMPLLSGLDLDQLLQDTDALHPTVAVRIIGQACIGVQVAHEAGVIHRDIKPANIYLDHSPTGEVTARVLDFGIAKLSTDESITRYGSVMGTPHYMSLEQVKNSADVDERADVYSLACTLYHALTGFPPFDEIDNIADLFVAIATQEITPAQMVAPWLDPALATVVHGGLIRDVEKRCPTVAAFAEALKPFQMGSLELNAMMLQPISDELRDSCAPTAPVVDSWEPATPSIRTPALPSTERDPLLGEILCDTFTILRRLRSVPGLYEALRDDGERFALKIIDPEGAGTTAAKRFLREAKMLESIDSEHVVRLITADYDGDRQQPFFVMELLHGTDLASLIHRHGALDPKVVARLFEQACHGLSDVHAIGLVHRDIKPAKLFINRLPSGEARTKICGFGVAKDLAKLPTHTAGQLTRIGDVIGSPQYMSPEQARSPKDVDLRSDIWSLGATLYHALTGEKPWQTNSVADLILAISTQEIPRVRDKAPWVSRGLASVVDKALQRRPEDRFQTMAEMAEALRPFSLEPGELLAQTMIGPLAKEKKLVLKSSAEAHPLEATAPSRPPYEPHPLEATTPSRPPREPHPLEATKRSAPPHEPHPLTRAMADDSVALADTILSQPEELPSEQELKTFEVPKAISGSDRPLVAPSAPPTPLWLRVLILVAIIVVGSVVGYLGLKALMARPATEQPAERDR